VIRGALEAAGIILIDPDGEAGPGVRLRGDHARRLDHGSAGAGTVRRRSPCS
jgi:hypothetical protein